MTFYLKGHQIYQKSKLKLPKKMPLLCKMKSLNLQVVAVLMPLEIKRYTIPHLKLLILRILILYQCAMCKAHRDLSWW